MQGFQWRLSSYKPQVLFSILAFIRPLFRILTHCFHDFLLERFCLFLRCTGSVFEKKEHTFNVSSTLVQFSSTQVPVHSFTLICTPKGLKCSCFLIRSSLQATTHPNFPPNSCLIEFVKSFVFVAYFIFVPSFTSTNCGLLIFYILHSCRIFIFTLFLIVPFLPFSK